MIPALFVASCALLLVRALRQRLAASPEAIRRRLLQALAAAVGLRVALEVAELGALRPYAAAFLALAALAGLYLWSRLAALATFGLDRRGLMFRAPWALALVVSLFARGGWPTLAFFSAIALLSFRWRTVLPTRQLFGTAVAALLYVALSLRHWVSTSNPLALAISGPVRSLHHFDLFANAVSVAYAFFAIAPVLRAFLADPTLGIHAVRRRLGLSHVLVVLVPLAITIGLWVLTTWLGVGVDRAGTGARMIESEGRQLGTSLSQALAAGGDSRAALRAVADARRASWPHLGVWSADAGGILRVAGDSLPGEPDLRGWVANLDSLPGSGIVELRGWRYLGAAVRDRAHAGAAAVALVPVGEALAGDLGKAVGARLVMSAYRAPNDSAGGERGDSLRVPQGSDSSRAAYREAVRALARRELVADSLRRARRAARNRPSATLVASGDNDTVFVGAGAGSAGEATSLAVVRGLRERHGRWARDSFSVQATVTLLETLAGLYRSARENPFNFVSIALLAGLGLLLIPVAIFNFAMVGALARSVLEPLGALQRAATALGREELDHRIELRGDDELWQTAGAFNRMAADLERARALRKERDRMEHELELARRIQARLLPDAAPHLAGLEIAGVSEPAREVGGDYFDHIPLGGERVMLVIADVSGKGVPAALLMSGFRASLMSQDTGGGPAAIAHRLNAFLHSSVEPGKFVTAFVAFLDGRSGRMVHANAGHNPPLVVRANGDLEWLEPGGLILGVLPDSDFESGELTLEPGDVILLYTDGVTEGAGADGEQFGEERLAGAARRLAGGSVEGMVRSIVREVRAFEGESGPADDITLLAARRCGPRGA